jgi:hypothetical protein
MTDDTRDSTRFSLRRWSQRKLAATHGEDAVRRADTPLARATPSRSEPADATPHAAADAPAADAMPSTAAPSAVATASAAPRSARASTRDAGALLPSLDSLTIDSDYSPFMQPGVDEAVKRSALRKLLRHPRFNVMDGLDVYIDDYSLPSPIEPALARSLMQARYLFNPPQTRVNADGHVEDVPDASSAGAEDDASPPDKTRAGDAQAQGDAETSAAAGPVAETLPLRDASNDAGLSDSGVAQPPTGGTPR